MSELSINQNNPSIKKTVLFFLVVWIGALTIALSTSMIDEPKSDNDFIEKQFKGEISLLKDTNNQTMKYNNKELFIVQNLTVELNGVQLDCSSSNAGILCSEK